MLRRFEYLGRRPGHQYPVCQRRQVARRTAKALGAGYHVIEEGLGGRTTVWEDPIEGHKNGKEYLVPCLGPIAPLDLVIIMLGTNDLKNRFSATAQDIAAGAGILVEMVNKSGTVKNPKTPKVLLLAPPPLGKLNGNEEMFEGGREKSRKFSQYFNTIADMYGCEFFDTSTVIKSSDIDGIHLDKEAHRQLGKAVAGEVKRILE